MNIANWISIIKLGEQPKDKFKIIIAMIFSEFFSFLRLRIGDLIANNLLKRTVVKINSCRFKLIDTESLYIISPMFEYWVWETLHSNLKSGGCFIDIGAHIGKYTIPVAKIVGDKGLVVAIEAHPENYQILIENILLNHLTNVKALNLAAWNENYNLRIFTGKSSGRHSVKKEIQILLKNASERQCFFISAQKVDCIIEKLGIVPNIIKIDAGGRIRNFTRVKTNFIEISADLFYRNT